MKRIALLLALFTTNVLLPAGAGAGAGAGVSSSSPAAAATPVLAVDTLKDPAAFLKQLAIFIITQGVDDKEKSRFKSILTQLIGPEQVAMVQKAVNELADEDEKFLKELDTINARYSPLKKKILHKPFTDLLVLYYTIYGQLQTKVSADTFAAFKMIRPEKVQEIYDAEDSISNLIEGRYPTIKPLVEQLYR